MAHQSLKPNLDPEDWEDFRKQAHRAVDEMTDYLRDVRDRPVWQPMPEAARQSWRETLPRDPSTIACVLDQFGTAILPFANGNGHPLFMGWVHGAGTPAGMLAELLSGGLNSNCGGRDHVGLSVERQLTLWMAEAFGLPLDSSGVLVTGTSMANFLAVLIARTRALGSAVRRAGLRGEARQLTAYASSEAHACIAQAMEMAGLGSANLRLVETEACGRLALGALKTAIGRDRQVGCQPFLVIGTAGSVNIGAIDDLQALADLASAEDLWLHVDGAFGATAVFSDALRPRLKGLERADSIAFDFHKWVHVPYDCGFLIVRDPAQHFRTFGQEAAYLSRLPRGLASGDVWPCDLGPDLSRGFRALKVWFTLKVFGTAQIGACMEENCRVAAYLAKRLEGCGRFALDAPVLLNIVCFGLLGDDGSGNAEIVMRLQERGWAAPSVTQRHGRVSIRAAIVNHRTTTADMDVFVDQLERVADELAAERR
jgi:aromatic-L-amino-acid decarboxylase